MNKFTESDNPYRDIAFVTVTGKFEVRSGHHSLRHRGAIAVCDTLQEAIDQRDRREGRL